MILRIVVRRIFFSSRLWRRCACRLAVGNAAQAPGTTSVLGRFGARPQSEVASQPADLRQGAGREPGAQVPPSTSPPSFPRYLVPLPGEAPAAAAHGPAERLILLTFDDGPELAGDAAGSGRTRAPQIESGLFRHGPAHRVRNRPEDLARRDLLRRLVVHGHHVGNHTMNHKDLCQEPRRPGRRSRPRRRDHHLTPRACGRCSFESPTAPVADRSIGHWLSATSPRWAGMRPAGMAGQQRGRDRRLCHQPPGPRHRSCDFAPA